jgi:uncharacterized protein (DUF1778 family)
MPVSTENEKATLRLELPVTFQQEALIRHAAEIAHKSIAEFILHSACAYAENALSDQRVFLLDDEKWQKFQEALDRPAVVNPHLKGLMEEKSPWE